MLTMKGYMVSFRRFFGKGNKLATVTSQVVMYPRLMSVVGYFESEADLAQGKRVEDCSLIDFSKYPDFNPGADVKGSWMLASSAYAGSDDRCRVLEKATYTAAEGLYSMKSQKPLSWWTASCVDANGAPRRATVALSSDFVTVLDKAGQAFASKPEGMIYSKEELEKEGGPQAALFDLSDLLDEYASHKDTEWACGAEYNPQAGLPDLIASFKGADKAGNGMITMTDLVGLIMDVQPKLSEAEVKTMCAAADLDKDGNVDYSEFCQWMFK